MCRGIGWCTRFPVVCAFPSFVHVCGLYTYAYEVCTDIRMYYILVRLVVMSHEWVVNVPMRLLAHTCVVMYTPVLCVLLSWSAVYPH